MAKKPVVNPSSDPHAKKVGRSSGNLEWSEELGRKTTPKIIRAIKSNKS
jgi:hypothetical protein